MTEKSNVMCAETITCSIFARDQFNNSVSPTTALAQAFNSTVLNGCAVFQAPIVIAPSTSAASFQFQVIPFDLGALLVYGRLLYHC